MSNLDDPQPEVSRGPGCLMQVVTHGVALVLGGVLGVVGAQVVEYMQDPETLSRPEGELSRAQLIAKLDEAEKKYADILAEGAKKEETHRTEFEAASAKVLGLQGDVSKKEDEVKVLELKVRKGKNKSAALERELEEKQAELGALQVLLDEARVEQDRLKADLVVAHEETTEARQQTNVARNETVDARWDTFKTEAIVSICEKGNRNKLAKCRDEVREMMDSKRAARFKQCVGSKQAVPRLVKADPKVKDPELPRWSEWFNQDSAFTENKWYLVFCDPTLPEATLGDDVDDF